MDGEPGRMRAAVEAALAGRAPPVDPRDAGAEQLAVHYAQLVDEAESAARYDRALLHIESACRGSDDPAVAPGLRLIRTALAQHTVASDLGPKLLAVLDALGLTPKARAAAGRKGATGDEPDPLDELRARRQRRTG